MNSSRPGCAVGGKSKPSSDSRAAPSEDCDALSGRKSLVSGNARRHKSHGYASGQVYNVPTVATIRRRRTSSRARGVDKARAGCKERIIGPKRIESRLEVQLSDVARRGSRREVWARRMASMAGLVLAVLILFLLVTLSPVCAAIAAVIAYRRDRPRTIGPI